MKPITFDQFDGGITDKDVPGRTNRYSICDNLLIDYDKKLLQRDGFDIYSSTAYQLAAAERVARLVNFDTDSEVLPFQNKKAFAISAGAWAEVQGPGGGSSAQHAFNTNSAVSLLEEAQWQHHLYVATDSGDPVVKMYRDSGNTMRLRTAGLPEFTDALTPTDGGLADAITLINDLRSKMTTHYQANGATAGAPNNLTGGHHSSNAALTSQASAASGSTVASDLPTLITLLNLLRVQYNAHISDAQKEDPGRSGFSFPAFRNYHAAPASGGEAFVIYYDITTTFNQPNFQWRHFLNFTLEDLNYTIPSTATIANCLLYLNDLRDKWNWHTYATNTHFNAMKWKGSANVKFGTHKTSLSRVAPYSWANITPNYGPFLQYVADLLIELNAHLNSDMHMPLIDSTNVVDASFPTSPANIWEAVCLLGGIADAFTYHAMEADPNFGNSGPASAFATSTATTASGTKTISWANGGTLDQYKYYSVIPIMGGSGALPVAWTIRTGNPAANDTFQHHANYKITGSTNATPTVLTVPTNVLQTFTLPFCLTTMQYHIGVHTTSIFSPRDFSALMDNQDYTLSSAASLQGIADYAQNLAGYMKVHATSQMSVNSGTYIINKLKFNGYDFDVYIQSHSALESEGQNYYTHLSADDTNYPNTVTFPQAPMLTGALWQQSRFALGSQPTAASFNYKMDFKYDYTVGTKSFTDRSAPSSAINVIGFINEDSGGSTELGKYAATFATIQAYANAANENFAHTDTTNFKKEIYRTLANGTRYYKTDINGTGGDITNATTSYSDFSSDTYLVDQLELYTNGGAPENNRPPVATGIHMFDNVLLYVVGNKVYQSISNDPDSVPSDFFEEFESNVVAVSSTRTVAVAFLTNKVYRLNGGFDDLGRGGIVGECIFDRTGAISSQSVVKADNGIFFAGKDGFYFTDGYQCMRVTDLEKTFRTYTDTAAKRNRIQGVYDNISKRVYWTIQTGAGSAPDKIWVLDLQFGIKPDATPVVTLSKTSGFNPTALTYFNGQIYYGDGDGYVFVQTRGRNYDLVKDTGTAATAWSVETTQWDMKGCNYQYGTEAYRKYFANVVTEFDMQSTNISAQIVSDADKGRIVSNLPVIRSRKLTDWGDSKLDWISGVYPAKPGNMVDETRNFKGDGSLRANYRAIEFKTAYCVIVKSDNMGTITIANVAGNVYSLTLTSLSATRKWPLYSVGYFVRINSVDYPVTVRTSDTVVRIDSTGLTSPSTGVPASWELWGYPKNERARLISYSVFADLEDQQQSHSEGPVTTGGQNA